MSGNIKAKLKKGIRVMIRFVVATILLLGLIVLFIKIGSSNIPDIMQLILFFCILGVGMLTGLILLLNPMTKLNLFKNRKRHINKPKKTMEFIQLINQLQVRCGEQLNKCRKRVLNDLIMLGIMLILQLIMTIFIYQWINLKVQVLIAVYVLSSMLVIYRYKKDRKRYNELFKKNVIKELVVLISPNLSYQQDGNEQMCNQYLEADFEEIEFNTFESTDYIKGKLSSGRNMQMSKLSLLNCNQSGEKINVADTFLFVCYEMGFTSPHEVNIVKNKNIKIGKDRIEIDSSDFEKYFDVFCPSAMTAMQILTHDVLEEITSFYVQYKMNFQIVFRNNKIYIKFNTGDIFSPSIWKKPMDNDLLWTFYLVLNFSLSLSKKLDKLLDGTQI